MLPVVYLAVGIVIFLPANYIGCRRKKIGVPFWRIIWKATKAKPSGIPKNIILWPIVVLEAMDKT
jgi:hypothetical protein